MSDKTTSGQYFKSVQIVYFGLLAGQIIFGALIFAVTNLSSFEPDGKSLSKVFIFIVPVFIVGGFIVSRLLFAARLKAIKDTKGLRLKLEGYRAALVLRYALHEGPVLFALIVYLVTADLTFLLLAGVVILYFLTLFPTPEKAVRDLELGRDEEHIVADPQKEI